MFKNQDFVFNDNAVVQKTTEQLVLDNINTMRTYEVISKLMGGVSLMQSNDGVTLTDVLDSIAGDEDEGYQDFVAGVALNTLDKIGITAETTLDMLDSVEDMDLLVDHINTVMGDNSVDEVALALTTNDDCELNKDSGELELDWTAYPNAGKCKNGSDGKHPKLATHKCKPCDTYYRKGMKCRYPIKKKNGVYKGENPTADEKAHLTKVHNTERNALWKGRLSKAHTTKAKDKKVLG